MYILMRESMNRLLALLESFEPGMNQIDPWNERAIDPWNRPFRVFWDFLFHQNRLFAYFGILYLTKISPVSYPMLLIDPCLTL